MFRIDTETHKSERIEEVAFSTLGLKERQDIQEWIANNPSILGDDLLIINKEFSGFDLTTERLDLLAVDSEGKIVVIELKRDESGESAYWQAIKYASYFRSASPEEIVRVYSAYLKKMGSTEDAQANLLEHLGNPENLNGLNNGQRIILASRAFAPEVTSAAFWLNEKIPDEDLITCIQITPYKDEVSEALYIQTNTVLPVPGVRTVGIADIDADGNIGVNKLRSSHTRKNLNNKNDAITHFLRGVADRALSGLTDDEVEKPDKKSRWAGGWAGGEPDFRYYRLWYSDRIWWENWRFCYCVHLDHRPNAPETEGWAAEVRFQYRKTGKSAAPLSEAEFNDLDKRIGELRIHDEQKPIESGGWGGVSALAYSESLDDGFANKLAETLGQFIKTITPEVNDFEEGLNQEDA